VIEKFACNRLIAVAMGIILFPTWLCALNHTLEETIQPDWGKIFTVTQYDITGKIYWRAKYDDVRDLKNCFGSVEPQDDQGLLLTIRNRETNGVVVRVRYGKFGQTLWIELNQDATKSSEEEARTSENTDDRNFPYTQGWPYIGTMGATTNNQSLTGGDFDPSTPQKELTLCQLLKINAWNYQGRELEGWPINIDTNFRGASFIIEDSLGRLACSAIDVSPNTYVFRHDAVLENGWPVRDAELFDGAMRANMDADSSLEVIGGGDYLTGYRGWNWNLDASNLPAWPVTLSQNVVGQAVGDVNNDGQLEVVMTSFTLWNKRVWVISNTGQILYQWQPTGVNGTASENSPALADLDGDGDLEIILGGYSDVICWSYDGRVVWGPLNIGGNIGQTAVSDLDNDDSLEVVVISTSTVRVLNADGSLHAGNWPYQLPTGTFVWSSCEHAGSAVGDIDNDGEQEIVLNAFTTGGVGHIYHWLILAFNPDGRPVRGFPIIETRDYTPACTPVIFDLDNDGNIEIASFAEWHPSPIICYYKVSVFDLPTPYNPANIDWPMIQHDAQRTGCYGGVELDSRCIYTDNSQNSLYDYSSNLHFTASPNPFNNETEISFYLPRNSNVELIIYDVNGKEVNRLFDGYYPAGELNASFNGSQLSSGIYFVVLETDEGMMSRKLILLK
jgi:hypothetical protein